MPNRAMLSRALSPKAVQMRAAFSAEAEAAIERALRRPWWVDLGAVSVRAAAAGSPRGSDVAGRGCWIDRSAHRCRWRSPGNWMLFRVKALKGTPASPAAFIRALVDAGMPDGVIGLVFCDPDEISAT